jgi:hypothetical protein
MLGPKSSCGSKFLSKILNNMVAARHVNYILPFAYDGDK